MKMYLLDTNIISEPAKAKANPVVTEKNLENIEYSCISSVVWAETLSGINLYRMENEKICCLIML